jgi:hypothetical protein
LLTNSKPETQNSTFAKSVGHYFLSKLKKLDCHADTGTHRKTKRIDPRYIFKRPFDTIETRRFYGFDGQLGGKNGVDN